MKYSLSLCFMASIFFILVTKPAQADQKNTHTTKGVRANTLSDAIPRETPYIFGYDPKWEISNESTIKKSTVEDDREIPIDLLKSLWQKASVKADELSRSWTEEERATWQLIKTLPLPKSSSDLAQIGFDEPSAFWLYGLGLTPAFVVEVPSPKRLKSWVAKHLSSMNHGFREVKGSQGSYWRRPLKRWTILLRLKGHRLHAALIPQSAEPILLSYFLREREHVNVTAKLKDQFNKLPQQSKASGFISLKLLIDLIFGSSVPILKHSGQSLGLPNPLFSSCEEDLRSLSNSLQILTMGMKQLDNGTLDIFTHLTIPLAQLTPLQRLQDDSTPRLNLPNDYDAGGIATHLNFDILIKWIEQRGVDWGASPWTCPLLTHLNVFPEVIKNPQWPLAKSLLSPLKGLTLAVKKQAEEFDHSQSTAPHPHKTSFTGWLEINYPSPQFLVKLFASFNKLESLPAAYYQVDGQLRDISHLNPSVSQLFLSLNPKQLMLSMGAWGRTNHQAAQERAAQQLEFKRPSTKEYGTTQQLQYPLLWLSLPVAFSQWLKEKLSTYKPTTKANPSLDQKRSEINSKNSIFRIFSMHLSPNGMLFQVRLDTKPL